MNDKKMKNPNEGKHIPYIKYVQEISKYPLLSTEQERELAEKAHNGDKSALDKLIKCNLRLVVAFAKKYCFTGLDILDVIQSGNIGLIEAAKKYDPSLNFKFSTFASPWIKKECLKYVSEMKYMICLTPRVFLELQKIREIVEKELEIELCDISESDMIYISNRTGIPVSRAIQIINASIPYFSFDSTIGDNDDIVFEELIADQNNISAEDDHAYKDLCDELFGAIGDLTPKEKTVIKKRYGLEHEDPMTLQEIGKELSLSREGVRIKEKRALKKLKKSFQEQ